MVEAAVVMPVLIICFGVMMFAGGARHLKLKQQQLARAGVLTYATNACQGGGIGGGGGTQPSLRDTDPSVDPTKTAPGGAAGTAVTGASAETVDKLDKAFGTASGGPPAAPWTWNKAYVSGSVSVTGHSFYFCNEKDFGQWDFFSYAKNLMGLFLP